MKAATGLHFTSVTPFISKTLTSYMPLLAGLAVGLFPFGMPS
jgi:hypothetical protein